MLEPKVRPHIHRWSTQTFLALWIIWITTFFFSVKCSPVEIEWLRQRRDIYPEIQQEEKAILIENEAVCVVGDVVYAQGDSVPSAEQSCLRCRCQPPEVTCEAVMCEKKAGCRAIHKPNTCCPDYKCDCEYNGQFYSNGERLETKPGGECRVCYCRGGEVQCAKVTCYIRPDCQGRKVEGKCCPKYDHCPLREPYLERGHFVTTSKYEDSTTMPVLQSTSDPINTSSLDLTQLQNTSDKTDNFVAQNEIAELVPSCEDVAVPSEIIRQPEHSSMHVPKITIQEIIPELKEIAITSPPKREIGGTNYKDVHGQLLVEETFASDEKSDKSNGLEDLEDSDVESSEIAEIYQPPPVLRIGDKLLFLKQGELVHEKDVSTPKTVITIIGAEGLQRGFEESFEAKDATHSSTLDTPRQAKDVSRALDSSANDNFNDLNEAESGSILGNPEYDNGTTSIEAGEVPEANITVNQNMTLDEENTSKRIITILKELISDNSSTWNSSETTEMFDLSTDATTEAGYNASAINLTMLVDIELPSIDYELNGTNFNTTEDWVEIKLEPNDLAGVNSTFYNQSNGVVLNSTKDLDREEIDNPEYPPIPDVMTSQNHDGDTLDDSNATTTTESTTTSGLKILPVVLEVRSNKTVDCTNGTKNEWLKSTETVYNKDAIIPDAILKEIAPSDEDVSNATVLDDNVSSASSDFFDNQLKLLAPADSTANTMLTSPEEERDVESMEVPDVRNSTTANSAEEITDKSLVLETMSGEDASVAILDDVEVMNSTMNITHEEFTTVIAIPEDVEVFTTTTSKTVEKRHEDANDKIFEELSHEIQLEDGTIVVNKTKVEEEKEAEDIFKELLEETATTAKSPSISLQSTKNGSPQPRDRESAVLQRVSNAIAKFQLRDTKQSLDTSILGILRDFFSSQYRSYNRK